MTSLIFRPLTWSLLWNTVRLAVVVTAACAVIGTAVAWCVERTDLPGRRAWAVLAVVPLAIPDFVVSFGWNSLWTWAHGFRGAAIVMTLATYPLVYLPVAASLRSADPGQEEVARSLGVNRARTFAKITLGQAKGAILGGCLLVALVLLAEYGAFEILGYQTFTTEIFTELHGYSFAASCALSLVLVLFSLLVLAADGLLRGHNSKITRSGPMTQRVTLARALAIEPAVVLLDEPFASLDARLRAGVRADVQEIFRRAGTTAVMVTHDQDEALSTADRVAVLRDGKIAQCAPPEDLYRRPADAALAGFVGDANLLEGVLADGVVKTMLGPLPLDPAATTLGASGVAGRVTVLVRPEQIDLGPNEDGVTAQVTSYRYHGHDAVLYLQPGNDVEARPIVVRITGGPHRPVGSAVTLRARGPVFAWPAD